MKKQLIIGGSIFLAGLLIFLAALAFLNWDISKLSTSSTLEKKEMAIPFQNQSITIQDRNMPYVVMQSPDNDIHLTYYVSEKENYDIDSNGSITITKTTHYRWYDLIFNVNFQNPVFTIQLPEKFNGNLEIKTNNGAIQAKDITAENIIFTTNNGAITLRNLQLNGNITITSDNGAINVNRVNANENCSFQTSNGKITIDDVSAAALTSVTNNGAIEAASVNAKEKVTFHTNNSAIHFADLNAESDVELKTSNGSITGNLLARMSDFSITSKTSNGSNNLPESAEMGSQKLNVKTSNGKIKIEFLK